MATDDRAAAFSACQEVLDSLGGLGCRVTVDDARFDAEPDSGFQPMSVVLTLAIDGETAGAGVVYSLIASRLEAIVALASQVQDAITESRAAWGAAVPACDVHGHPLTSKAVDGVALWVCPAGAQGASRVIASAAPSA